MANLSKRGVLVYGVSKDSLQSHQGFIEKHDLNFVLLSDPEMQVQQMYGAIKPEGGTLRSTFLIDTEGKISHIWSPVSVPGHVDAVVAQL